MTIGPLIPPIRIKKKKRTWWIGFSCNRRSHSTVLAKWTALNATDRRWKHRDVIPLSHSFYLISNRIWSLDDMDRQPIDIFRCKRRCWRWNVSFRLRLMCLSIFFASWENWKRPTRGDGGGTRHKWLLGWSTVYRQVDNEPKGFRAGCILLNGSEEAQKKTTTLSVRFASILPICWCVCVCE